MKFVSRAIFAVVVIGTMFAQPMLAQQLSKIPDSELAPSSMRYVPLKEYLKSQDAVTYQNYVRPPLAPPSAGDDGEAVLVGTMINAYTSQSTITNQLGYDWKNNVITALYRGGPSESYPNEGNGSLVLNTSSDGGATWTGNSPIFNDDLRGNIQGQELSARHPSIYSMDIEGTTSIATVWSNIYATFLNPDGVLGELAHKAGPLGGPYSGDVFDKSTVLQYFPNRIVADKNGILYSVFQTINLDQDLLTGEYFLMKSVDNGKSWTVDYNNPIVSESQLEDDYQIFYSATTIDVSPDGSVIYLGFLGIFVEDESFTFTDNRLGYVRSTDGGTTWSDPVMYPLYTWDMGQTPVNTLDGWMIPSIGLVVDGLNQPHFLVSVNGQDTFYPLDSTLIGEVTVNPEDPSEPPEFFALAMNILPDYRRMINPRNATSGAQPTFSIWAEHDWAKDPDGMKLIAKWIDADSLFVTTPDTHPDPIVRDSTHDIFFIEKDVNQQNNENRGWNVDVANNTFLITNATNSVGVDEKFTKMNPIFNPDLKKMYFLYTIMATGEFVSGQIFPDTDDLGPAELFFLPYTLVPTGIADGPEGLPEGFELEQNYPNPFNPTTNIRFSIPEAGIAKVRVFNMLGKEVALAYEGYTEAGQHNITFNAANLPSGQYLYRLESNGYSVSSIMTLMK